jgi:multicomponent Na+:H+ antiporter subunit D
VVYVWRVVEAAYFQPPTEKTMDAREAPVSLVAGAWILISASVCFGSNATLTSTLSAGAARALLGGGP